MGDAAHDALCVVCEISLGRGGDLRFLQLWRKKDGHDKTGDEQGTCPGKEFCLATNQGKEKLAYAWQKRVGQQACEGEERKAPCALPWRDALDQKGDDAGGEDGQKKALHKAQNQKIPLEKRRGGVEVLIGQKHARGDEQRDQDCRQFVESQHVDAGKGSCDHDHAEEGAKEKPSPVWRNGKAFEPLLEAVVDGKVAVAEQDKKEEQDKVEAQELLSCGSGGGGCSLSFAGKHPLP